MTIRQYVGQSWDQGGAKIVNLGTPTASGDAATKGYVDSLGGSAANPTIYYTGTAWPARTTVTVPSGGHVIYDSTAYSGAPQPSDWTGNDEWNYAGVVVPALSAKQVSMFHALPGANTVSGSIGTTVSVTGTSTVANVTSNGTAQTKRARVEAAVTVAATTAVCGWRDGSAKYTTGGGFVFVMRGAFSRGVAADATRRFFMGMASTTGAYTDSSLSSQLTDGIGVMAESTDTNLFITYRTATGTQVKVDTGMVKSVADNTEMYELQMVAVAGGTTIQFTFKRLSDGTTFTHTSTTAIPGANTLLTWRLHGSVGGTSSVIGVDLNVVYIENVSA